MKIEREELKFNPVTIVLESQAELDALFIALGELSVAQIRGITTETFDMERAEGVVKVFETMYDKIADLY